MTKAPRRHSQVSRRTQGRRAQRLAEWRVRLGLLLLFVVFLWGSYVGLRRLEMALSARRRVLERRNAPATAPPTTNTPPPAGPTRD